MNEGRLPLDNAREEPECRDISDFSRDELLAHINALEMEISGKDGIIQSLRGDLPISTDQTNAPVCNRRLENKIVEQNLMIESLREELEFRQNQLERLNDESLSLRDEARNEIQLKESRWIEENSSLVKMLEELKNSSGIEKDDLQFKLEREIKKTYILQHELELSSHRLEELHKRELDHEAEMNIIRGLIEDGIKKSNISRLLSSESQVSPLPDLSGKSSSKIFALTDESTQCEMTDGVSETERLTGKLIAALKWFETENSKLKETCFNHQMALDKMKDDLTNNFFDDLNQVNQALNRLHEIVLCLSSSKSFEEHQSIEDCDTFNASVDSPDLLLNILMDKIEKCSLEIGKYHDGVEVLKNENERISNENELLTGQIECLRNTVSTVEGTNDQVLRIQYEASLKKKEEAIASLKAALDESNVRELKSNEEIKRLKDDLNSVDSRFKELKKLYDKLVVISQDGGGNLGDLVKKEAMSGDGPTTFDGDRLSPISKFSLPSELTPPKLFPTNFITSTPYPAHLKGAGEGLSPDLSTNESSCQLIAVKWVEHCHKLNSQNSVLKNQINDLKIVISKLESNTASILNEMSLIDLQRKELDAKLSDYAEIKRKCCELTESSMVNQLKMAELQQEVERLRTLNGKLTVANENYESKSEENYLLEVGQHDLLKDLNNKMKEIIFLKGQVYTLGCTKHALQQKCDKLSEEKNIFILKLEQQTTQLNLLHNDIERLLLDNSNLTACLKCLKNDNQILKESLEHLNNQRKLNWGLLENQVLAEEMLGAMSTLCREAIEKKLEFEKLLSRGKSGGHVDEMDARHSVELLMKDNGLLVHQKETLLTKILELERNIHEIQKSQGSGDYISHMDNIEASLVKEIRDQREQHARIEEAIRSTGKLHNELQKEKDETKIKVVELAKLQKKYLDEKLKAQTVEMDVKFLKEELRVKSELLKALESEKLSIEHELKTSKEKLISTEQKLAFEVKCNQIKSKSAEIQNAKNEIVEQFSTATEDRNLLVDEDFEYYKMIRLQIESNYTRALETMKIHLAEEFAQKALNDHISHVNQVDI